MASITLQSMGPEGAALMSALHAHGFEAAWGEAEMLRLLASTGVEGLVLMEDGSPLAMMLIRAIAGEAEILTLAVPRERRGEGLGRRLVEAGLDAAQCAGATRMYLEVSHTNAAAEAVYRRCGFVEAGRRKAYYRDGSDALVMARSL